MPFHCSVVARWCWFARFTASDSGVISRIVLRTTARPHPMGQGGLGPGRLSARARRGRLRPRWSRTASIAMTATPPSSARTLLPPNFKCFSLFGDRNLPDPGRARAVRRGCGKGGRKPHMGLSSKRPYPRAVAAQHQPGRRGPGTPASRARIGPHPLPALGSGATMGESTARRDGSHRRSARVSRRPTAESRSSTTGGAARTPGRGVRTCRPIESFARSVLYMPT